ncbi:MAG: TilS substrate C-terminal domain-containing protein, partial [Gemmatimonadaceae bacterium]
VRRTTLEAFAASAGIEFVEDPGNASREFSRNRVRHDLLPALRRVRAGFDDELLSVSTRAALLRKDVESFVDAVLEPDVSVAGRVVTDVNAFDTYEDDSLALLWGALAGRAGLALDRRGTSRAVAFTKSGARSGSVQIAGGWVLEATSSAYIMERPATSAFPAVAKLPQAGSLEWGHFRFRVGVEGEGASPWAATIIGDGAMVRAWSAGDRLEPAGGQRKRRVTRYLSDVGLTGRERAGWPVVLSGEDVVWIPGVRRSDAATDRSGRPARHYVCERTDR